MDRGKAEKSLSHKSSSGFNFGFGQRTFSDAKTSFTPQPNLNEKSTTLIRSDSKSKGMKSESSRDNFFAGLQREDNYYRDNWKLHVPGVSLDKTVSRDAFFPGMMRTEGPHEERFNVGQNFDKSLYLTKNSIGKSRIGFN